MKNKEFAKILEERTLLFAIKIIRLSGKLPHSTEGNVVRNQLTKAGTSIGANYKEANRSRSKADFKNKIKICESEASETVYWLKLVYALSWLPKENIEEEIKEANELLAIFTSIGKNLGEAKAF
jgi:four helix bundle protein